MKLDDETRSILFERLKLTNEEIGKYERGYLTLSKNDEFIIRSAKVSRKLDVELLDIAPMLDKCDIFNANKSLFNMAYKVGEMHSKNMLTAGDRAKLMTKLDDYNTAGKLVCECKNRVPRVR